MPPAFLIFFHIPHRRILIPGLGRVKIRGLMATGMMKDLLFCRRN